MAADDRDVLDLWQNQTAEGFRMTPKEIQMKAQELDRKVRVRTHGGYLVCAFLTVAFSIWAVVEPDPLMRAGSAALIVALAYLAWQIHQNRFWTDSGPAMAAAPSIDHLRAQLERQRDFHRGRRFWSRMLLLAPAGLLFFAGFARAHPEVIRIIRFEVASFIVLVLAAIPLNLWMARKYQRQIDELDAQKEERA